jgi:hypothetical protein
MDAARVKLLAAQLPLLDALEASLRGPAGD